MKHIKPIEDKSFKKFILCETIEHWPSGPWPNKTINNLLQIWEILKYVKDKNKFELVKIYQYETDTDNIIDNMFPKSYMFDKKTTYEDVVFETDNLEEALDYMKIKIDAYKYNL